MKTKTRTPEEELARLTGEYLQARLTWEDIKVYGCRDPFWEDGVNMNLERNHCIHDRGIRSRRWWRRITWRRIVFSRIGQCAGIRRCS